MGLVFHSIYQPAFYWSQLYTCGPASVAQFGSQTLQTQFVCLLVCLKQMRKKINMINRSLMINAKFENLLKKNKHILYFLEHKFFFLHYLAGVRPKWNFKNLINSKQNKIYIYIYLFLSFIVHFLASAAYSPG